MATIYIQSDEQTQVNVIPYFQIPNIGDVYLGFGQTVYTNQWTPVVWRQVIDSTSYSDDFISEIIALRDKFGIKDLGYIRLTHVSLLDKVDGTTLGFAFRLLSDKPEGEEDVFEGKVYLSSLTFFP